MTSVVDKLQKLIAHERSAREIGNLAEAETFAAKIAELLFTHKLSMSEVEIADEERNEPVAQETIDGLRAPWAGTLAMGIAGASFCRVLQSHTGYIFIGRTSDRLAAMAMFRNLAVTGRKLSESELAAYKKTEQYTYESSFRTRIAATWKASFLHGYAQAIYMRLQSERKQLTVAAQNAGSSLVWINKTESALAEYMAEKYPRLGRSRQSHTNLHGDAYRAGQARGSNVSLKAQAALTGGR